MAAKFRKPVNLLAWRVGQKGVSRGDAVVRAKANVDAMRDDGLGYIDAHLEKLDVLLSSATEGSARQIGALYDASDAIASTAGVFGFTALGKAAFGLCELLSQFEQGAEWRPDAVKVHLDSMSILRRRASSPDDADAVVILDNLAKLTARLAT